VFDENGFGHHRAHASRAGELTHGRQDVEKQDDQVAHATIVKKPAKSKS
jgi:hypothetical protein